MDGGDFSRRRGRHFGSATAERLCERVPDFSGRVPGRHFNAGAAVAVPLLALIAGLALIGGLAAACFTKAFGVVFLGEPRTEHVSHTPEAGWAMRLPMLLLAAGCALIGLFAPFVVGALKAVLENMTGLRREVVRENLAAAAGPLALVVIGAVAFLLMLVVLVLLRAVAGRSPRGGGRHLGIAVTRSRPRGCNTPLPPLSSRSRRCSAGYSALIAGCSVRRGHCRPMLR